MNRTLLLVAGLAAASLTNTAFAAEGATGFFRGEVGETRLDVDGASGNEFSYSLRGGYFFNANWGIEGFHSDLGRDSDDFSSVKATSYGIGAIAKKNFGGNAHEGFYINGRLGVARTEVKVDIDGFGSFKEANNQPYVGVGFGYDFNPNFGLSLNVDHQQVDLFDEDFKFTTATIGAEYRF